jgi:hypothetical protein
VGTAHSGYEHDTTSSQNYQTFFSAVFQSLEHRLIKDYLQTKTHTSYRHHTRAQACSTCTAATTFVDTQRARIVDHVRRSLSTTDWHDILDHAVLSTDSS